MLGCAAELQSRVCETEVLEEMKPSLALAKAMLQCPMLIVRRLKQLQAQVRESRRGELMSSLRAADPARLHPGVIRAGRAQVEYHIRLSAVRLGKSLFFFLSRHCLDAASHSNQALYRATCQQIPDSH